jgi:uncharacterized membrane protein YfcA
MSFMISILMGSCVGVLLGFFGSGGSVLAVPIFVYVLGLPPKEAIVSSLIVVGFSSIVGTIQKIKQNQVCFRIATLFGLSGVAGSFLGARISSFLSGNLQLVIFAILMMASAVSMLRSKNTDERIGPDACLMARSLALGLGLVVGFLTGIVGIGGGFLIVPVLSFLGGLNIRMAMGTSLLIVSLNAIAGSLGYLGRVEINWPLLLVFVLASSLASLLGVRLSAKANSQKMQKAFAVFVLLMGILMLYLNLRGFS